MRQVIDYYHETLKKSPEALDYLEQRRLNELLEAFKAQPAAKSLGLVIRKAEWVAGATAKPGASPTTPIDVESVVADDEVVVDESPLVADEESAVSVSLSE